MKLGSLATKADINVAFRERKSEELRAFAQSLSTEGLGLYANDVFIEPIVEVFKSRKLVTKFPAVLNCPDQHPTSGLLKINGDGWPFVVL